MTSNVLESLPPKASAASVVNELMSAARTYSKATAFRAYKDRKDALMEIDALVRTITKAEYLQMENDDKADLEVLGQMLRESQFSGRVPVWLGKSKTQVVGKLTTSRADV